MYISKRNRRGLVYLIVILLIISFTPRILTAFHGNELEWSFEELKKAESKLSEQADKKPTGRNRKASYNSKFRPPSSKFDPNDYSLEDWKKLGLSEKQAAVVLKFTERGVSSNKELKKIFVIPEVLFDMIKDSTEYKVIPDLKEVRYSNHKKTEPEISKIYELNTINKEELMSLPGIGDYFSDKIIAYRDKLGGFHSKAQLLEVWNFNEEKYDRIQSYLEVSGNFDKININQCTVEELKQHPYLRYQEANSIVKMREQLGGYQVVADIKKSKLIDEELYKKIEPYLTVK